jgi:hypothetical protein
MFAASRVLGRVQDFDKTEGGNAVQRLWRVKRWG